jgi:hypothetical protein
MLLYFLTIGFSVNLSAIDTKRISSIRFHAVDSVLCYAKYTAALSALQTEAGKITRKSASLLDSPADELGAFATACANKNSVKACGDVVTAQTDTVTKDGPKEFTDNCKIDEPKADAEDCYSAYDALIKALEALKPTTPSKIQLKATDTQLDNFVTKCAKTSHSDKCLAVLSPIDPAVGPVYDNLDNIQKNCVVEAPSTGGGDFGIRSFSTSSGFLIIITILANFYLLF